MRFFSLKTAWPLCLALLALTTLATAEAPKDAAQETPKIMAGLPQGTYAWFKTTEGEFVAKLFTDLVPNTTANFIGLAEGTKTFIDPNTGQEGKRPYYDGVTFHRVIPDFMIQGGDPTGTGMGGPGYRFKDEINPKLRHDKPGMLSMANSGPNTNGSQFFITVAPTTGLDGKHAVFAEIVKGLDVVMAISKVPTNEQNKPLKPVVMEKVRIFRVTADAKPADAPTTGTQTR